MVNVEKAVAAIRSKKLNGYTLVDNDSTTYCAIGALLSYTGVSDRRLHRLGIVSPTTFRILKKEYGLSAIDVYDIRITNDRSSEKDRKRKVVSFIKSLNKE